MLQDALGAVPTAVSKIAAEYQVTHTTGAHNILREKREKRPKGQ
jgi:hypothetical protein